MVGWFWRLLNNEIHCSYNASYRNFFLRENSTVEVCKLNHLKTFLSLASFAYLITGIWPCILRFTFIAVCSQSRNVLFELLIEFSTKYECRSAWWNPAWLQLNFFLDFCLPIHTQLTTCGIPLVVQRFSYVPYRMIDIAIHREKGRRKGRHFFWDVGINMFLKWPTVTRQSGTESPMSQTRYKKLWSKILERIGGKTKRFRGKAHATCVKGCAARICIRCVVFLPFLHFFDPTLIIFGVRVITFNLEGYGSLKGK